MGPETYKGLPSAFDFSNKTRGLDMAWSAIRATDGRDGRTHFMSRDEFILAAVIVYAFDISGIVARKDKYVEEQKKDVNFDLIDLSLPD